MSILDSFFILFESDTSKLDKGLSDADKKTSGFLDKLRQVDKVITASGGNFRDLVGKLAGVAGVSLSFGALVHGIRETAAEYYALERLATQFRSTVDAVDEFRDAAGLLDISQEKSTEGLHALERAAQDTAMGMGRAKKVFEELGIEVQLANGDVKATTDLMTELAGKFEGMDKGKQIRVMERLGLDPALLKLFNSDLAALQKRMGEVDRAAGFNLQTAVKRAQEYTKASKELNLEFNTLKLYLGKLSEAFKISALPWFTEAMKSATVYVRQFVEYLLRHAPFVKGLFIAIAAAISYYLIPAAVRGAMAVWAMLAPFLLIGLAVAAAAVAFALLYDDIVNFLEGNDSLLGRLLEKYPQVAAVAKDIGHALRFVFDVAKALAGFLIGMWASPSEAFATFKADILDGLNELFDKFPGLKAGFDTVMEGVRTAGAKIVDVWDAIVAAVRLALGVLQFGANMVGEVVGKIRSVIGVPAGGFGAPMLGLATTPTGALAAQGQQVLAAAGRAPITNTTSSAINNSRAVQGGDRNVTIQKIEVQTQATDADGIAAGVGGALGAHLRKASSQYDDGIAG